MPEDPIKSTRRVLEPSERIAEVLFGLIMVLTLTGSLRVAYGRAQRCAHDAHQGPWDAI